MEAAPEPAAGEAATEAAADPAGRPSARAAKRRRFVKFASRESVMRHDPRMVSRAEAQRTSHIAVSEAVQRSIADETRSKEAPAKRIPENPISRNPGVGRKPRAPVPARTIPARPAIGVFAGRLHVGFRQVSRPQAGPAIERVFAFLFLEAFDLRFSVDVHRQFMTALHRPLLAVEGDLGPAVPHANVAIVGV